MAIQKQIREITGDDIDVLMAAAIPTGKTVEYCDCLALDTDNRKQRFIASAASFANALGGDFIFGIKSDNGLPGIIVPLQDFNPNRDVKIMEDLLRTHIDPPILGVECKEVSVEGGIVLLMRIPKSWAGAHIVTYKNENRFYTRDTSGCVLMAFPEIRSSILLLENVAERIRRLRFERLNKIREGDLPIAMVEGAKVVLHLFPLRSFEPGFRCDVSPLLKSASLEPMQVSSGWSHTHDLDGVYVYDKSDTKSTLGYSAALRNGCIEIVQRIGIPSNLIPNPTLEEGLLKFYAKGLSWLHELGMEPPLMAALSVLDVKDFILQFGPGRPIAGLRPIKQRDLIVHETLTPSFQTPADTVLRAGCDALWQACGLQRSFNFDETGKWKPQTWH
jgi:hypothetical protein